jgi:predicted AlkP superfamily phosphohydrolase/phosphomutase
MTERVMMIGLDGFELSLAERMMAEGRLPVLAGLERDGARLLLDHGEAKRTGLAGEHFSSGLSPEAAQRWAAVDFDPTDYSIGQKQVKVHPFPEKIDRRCVVFDAPYFDLASTRSIKGVVGWGAHDPGVPPTARPSTLALEIAARFGRYPAVPYIYGFTWPSAEETVRMGEALEQAVLQRSKVAEWLFSERLPDWDLGLVVISEYHSAIEAMWHGVDPDHPLHDMPSATPARVAVEKIYEAADRMVGALVAKFPDARYQRYWRDMPAFALPSYYDGRIRINLKGREAAGTVEPDDYDSVCATLASLLHECRDSITGKPVVASIDRADRAPHELGPTECDLLVVWKGGPCGLVHPRLGAIGPLPYRRTGGHTGETGVAYVSGPSIKPGNYPGRSAFDVVPTVVEMLGVEPIAGLSGQSFYEQMRV